jgi:peptide-methionine (R)-S-oxide reductase
MKIKPVLIIGIAVVGALLFLLRNPLFSGSNDSDSKLLSTNITLFSDSLDSDKSENQIRGDNMPDKVTKSEEDWKKELTEEEYRVLREKGTERAFSGKYDDFKDVGTFNCNACGNPVFYSSAKFESGCGWPSFFEPVSDKSLVLSEDSSHGMVRTEVTCGSCGSHLGHVFDDGPPPTGKRYCINSVSLQFKDKDGVEK